MRCVFCSHSQNPSCVKVCRIAPRSRVEVERTLSFMDRAYPVIIGESVTRVIEGEPFTHPEIEEILQLVRNRFKGTTIKITTNGSLLDERKVEGLRALGRVVINLSLNSASEKGRALLMGDVNAQNSIKCPLLLKKHGVPFHGSVVAMPHLVGWQDLCKTIKYLSECGAQTIRIFLPGYSKLAPPALRFEPSILNKLHLFIARLREKISTPLICEPPVIQDLEPRIAGVIADTPAGRAGIQTGDLIVAVNTVNPLTRVQAFREVYRTASPVLTIKRRDKQIKVWLNKKSLESSGLVMDYDIDPALIEDINRVIRRRRASEALIMTSEFAGPVINMALRQFYRGTAKIQVLIARNKFFGGSIKAAGLLTIEDFIIALEGFLNDASGWRPDLIMLPGLAFDHLGRDLTGCSYMDLAEKYNLVVETL
ncbi:DUF512 domain-containing protein [Pelotomaculum isophthalicicum JI]|uniref:DUF512 domain-containing protein n=2 Tax=Pelotomaculum TaxID=191373 RepID=A0A9X4JVY3_9FIRM|nr:DUF512 domain-containing protein [Pelotomaculum isophthalicicum JI]